MSRPPADPTGVRFFDNLSSAPQLGIAYGPGVPELIEANPGLIDYVEFPFEQLRHAPGLGEMQENVPVVLHCASLSVAGFVSPSASTVEAVAREAERTRTPWIGEHLAFVSADALAGDTPAGSPAPLELTYTVCPQLSEQTIDRVVENVAALCPRLPVPLVLENSPQYFSVPGSTMGMVDFIRLICARCNVGLLLDVTHFLITSMNTGVDPAAELDRFPLEHVVEVHISGLSTRAGVAWDDHGTPAPPLVFELVERALQRARPRALTLEYNWSPTFPPAILLSHLARSRKLLGLA